MSLVCDIPTALTQAETAVLQAIATGKNVLEVGALLGYSTVVLAQTAIRVVSIDPHEGYPEDNPLPTIDEYIDNIVRYKVQDRVIPVQATWQKAMRDGALHPGILYPYEVVFMDLTGKYEDTAEFLQYLAPEWGWSLKTIAVHDCGHPDWPGVDKAVEEFKVRVGMHHTFEQVDSLGVFRYV